MKREINCFVMAMCLVGASFIVSGCAEFESVAMDSVIKSEESPSTRSDSYFNIIGPNNAIVGTTVRYSLDHAFPSRANQPYIDITPETHSIDYPGRLASGFPCYDITFEVPGSYIITATDMWGEGESTYKTVAVAPPTPAVTPNRTADIRDGNVITYTVNNHLSGVSYEWEILEGGTSHNNYFPGASSFMILAHGHRTNPVPLIVRCRATMNGQYSNWATVYLTIQPGPPGHITIESVPDQES